MSPETVVVLNIVERRVLGVLVEKQKTTETYPLTLNSIVTGCNQKSNRDPFLDLKDDAVEEGLRSAQQKGLVMQVISGRVDKWKHKLYEAWNVSSVELAVLAELLLRGPQTEGELRARAGRMDEIRDVDHLREILKPLVERKLVVYLGPEGRRGTVLTHGFHDPKELELLRSQASHAATGTDLAESSTQPAFAAKALEDRIADLEKELAAVRRLFTELQDNGSRLAEQIRNIEKELGLSPPPAS
ncbi:MAG TPA: DUF480 domain-containing protein [Gemmataceae bacterium]|nr:DUF480 domain-containing protein [Gemmataceae bacterium]